MAYSFKTDGLRGDRDVGSTRTSSPPRLLGPLIKTLPLLYQYRDHIIFSSHRLIRTTRGLRFRVGNGPLGLDGTKPFIVFRGFRLNARFKEVVLYLHKPDDVMEPNTKNISLYIYG